MLCTPIPPNIESLSPDGHSQFFSGRKPSFDSHSFNFLLLHTNISHIINIISHAPLFSNAITLSSTMAWLLPSLEDPTIDIRCRDSNPLLTPGDEVDLFPFNMPSHLITSHFPNLTHPTILLSAISPEAIVSCIMATLPIPIIDEHHH